MQWYHCHNLYDVELPIRVYLELHYFRLSIYHRQLFSHPLRMTYGCCGSPRSSLFLYPAAVVLASFGGGGAVAAAVAADLRDSLVFLQSTGTCPRPCPGPSIICRGCKAMARSERIHDLGWIPWWSSCLDQSWEACRVSQARRDPLRLDQNNWSAGNLWKCYHYYNWRERKVLIIIFSFFVRSKVDDIVFISILLECIIIFIH